MQHAVLEVEKLRNQRCDIAVMLQPTTPLRSAADIDAGIQLLEATGADSVISVVDVGGNHPFRMKRIVGDNVTVNYIDQGFEDMRPRQQLPAVYIRSGALYITRRSVLIEHHSFTGTDCRAYVMPQERAINIDTRLDLALADCLLREYSRLIVA
jgi:CMP-N-acetylneuraminic acid synthetase